MTTLATIPNLPAPGRDTVVTFTFTESGSNFVRVWCTVAPTGSSLEQRLNSSVDPRNRVAVFEGSPGASWRFKFDKGGKYTFVAQEYEKGSGYGGGYEGDPNNSTNENKLGAEVALTLHVGQRVTQPIGPPEDQATLVLWVWDDTVRETTKGTVGEETPAIIATSPSSRVRIAMESDSVLTALDALKDADLADSGTIGDLTTWTQNLWGSFNAHIDSGSAHANVDTYNTIRRSFRTPPNEKAFIEYVNEQLRLLRQHVTNDTGAVDTGTGAIGPDTGDFHLSGSNKVSDRAALPLYQSVGSFKEAFGAFVDLRRCFELHYPNLDVHDNLVLVSMTPLTLLMEVHKAFLTVLAETTTVAVPPAQSTGVQLLISNAGFTEG